jgi:AraC-like DNA-binding protein
MSSLIYIEEKPPPGLVPYIECLWIAHDPRRRQHREPDRVLPDGCPEWIIHAADCFERLIGQHWIVQPRCFLAGTLTRPWLIRGGSRVRTLGIRFKPGGASNLLGVSLSDTADREVDLTEMGDASRGLMNDVRRARSPEAMFDAARNALLVLSAQRLPGSPRTRAATARIRRSRGKIRIEALASAVGTSRRTLERWFDTELGISPKQYARIIRFSAILTAVAASERARLVELALEGGYFDEAHLLLDVRRLAGRKLGKGSSDGELARHFTSPERLRALLEPAIERRR